MWPDSSIGQGLQAFPFECWGSASATEGRIPTLWVVDLLVNRCGNLSGRTLHLLNLCVLLFHVHEADLACRDHGRMLHVGFAWAYVCNLLC